MDPRRAAVVARDRHFDGNFVYAVKTTGVYCRPSCSARPKPENVVVFDTCDEAERAGFRACRRCHPKRDRQPARSAEPETRFAIADCSLGCVLVAASAKGVCAILLGDDPDELTRDLRSSFPNASFACGDADLDKLVAAVVGFIEVPRLGLDVPLDIRGTAFQRRVWRTLRAIGPGKTASYADIARRIGAPKAVRAVARACAANSIVLAIPCHRVVRNDGSLSGYRWGVERKRALLAKEAQA